MVSLRWTVYLVGWHCDCWASAVEQEAKQTGRTLLYLVVLFRLKGNLSHSLPLFYTVNGCRVPVALLVCR